MTDKKADIADEDAVITSIQRQFRGGEHKLSGQRASELIYAGGKPNAKLQGKVIEAIPGIERYISAPDAPVEMVGDQGGNPLATQPENRESSTGASNLSTDQARAEQNAIDKKLEKGRKNRVKKANADPAVDTGASAASADETKLNPDGSGKEDAHKL